MNSTCNVSIVVDACKVVLALGAVALGFYLVRKMDSDAAERVSIKAVDACKEYAVAVKGN